MLRAACKYELAFTHYRNRTSITGRRRSRLITKEVCFARFIALLLSTRSALRRPLRTRYSLQTRRHTICLPLFNTSAGSNESLKSLSLPPSLTGSLRVFRMADGALSEVHLVKAPKTSWTPDILVGLSNLHLHLARTSMIIPI